MVGLRKNIEVDRIVKSDAFKGKMVENLTNPMYSRLMSERKKFFVDVLLEKLTGLDRIIFKFGIKWGMDNMIAWRLKQKVSVIEKPQAFCVRVYNKDYDRKDLTTQSFIHTFFSMN